MKKFSAFMAFIILMSSGFLYAQKKTVDVDVDTEISADDQARAQAINYMLGGVFGAVTIDGKNYQQIGLRPELQLWKFGIGLDISVLLDEDGKVREEDWDDKEDYIDKIYYVRYGKRGEPFYFQYGGLESTTLGYGTLINGYTNMLEYPTYKRQGLDIGFETRYMGMQAIVNDFKELQGKNRAVMGGGRIYLKPFSRLQIGGSVAGDLNEYKGLRDTDDDGYPDEVDAYPENDSFVTEIEYYNSHGIPGTATTGVTGTLVAAGLLSPIERDDLVDYGNQRSRTGFWAGDAGLRLINGDFVKFDIYTQYARSMNTGGWGFTAPGVKLSFGNVLEIYGDYRQQSEDFIFGYYNDTYDLERAKYVDEGVAPAVRLVAHTKKEKLEAAEKLKGYFGGAKLNFFNIFTGKAEYQDMRWGEKEKEDKSVRGELVFNRELVPVISKAKAYYVQNNVEKLEWKTESTVMGAVLGIGMGEGISIDFNYLITYEDRNGDGRIRGGDEEITNVSVSTSAMF